MYIQALIFNLVLSCVFNIINYIVFCLSFRGSSYIFYTYTDLSTSVISSTTFFIITIICFYTYFIFGYVLNLKISSEQILISCIFGYFIWFLLYWIECKNFLETFITSFISIFFTLAFFYGNKYNRIYFKKEKC